MKYEFGKYPKPLFERDWNNDPFIMDNLLIAQATEKENGQSVTCFELCVNTFGQNIASQEVLKAFPDKVKMLEDIFNNQEPVSKAFRCGALIHGSPAIILSYSVDKENLTHPDGSERNVLSVRTRMMAEQLNEALMGHSVNICATISSDFRDEDNYADEIHAIIPADREQAARTAFEKEFDAVFERLALSKDVSWVKRQYDAFVNELTENTNKNWRPNLALKDGCSVTDVAIEACGFLGQKLGGRQFMFDKAGFSHDMEKAQKLAGTVDVTKNRELLESCLWNGAIRAEHEGTKKLTLYTKSPLDSLYSPSTDCLQITKNELRSILNEMGYDKDLSIPSFMGSYSYETATEIKSIYEDRHRKPLNQLLSDAKQRSGFNQDALKQEKGQEHNL